MIPGTYEVAAQRALTPNEALPLTGQRVALQLAASIPSQSLVAQPAGPLVLRLDGSPTGSLVIEEVYYTGSATPGSDPAVVVTATEFGDKLDRFRAYGYLFGYPEHAVTFFVEADRRTGATREFVKREFLAIPVHNRQDGRFTHAVPVGYQPAEVDLALRARAAELLAEYRRRRPRFVNAHGSLRAVELLREWYGED